METQLSPTRFRILGSGMIGELVRRLGEPTRPTKQNEYWDNPEWCGAFAAQHQLGVGNLLFACSGSRWLDLFY